MLDSQLLTIFDIHKEGKIQIEHNWQERVSTTSITLEDLFLMFELVREKRKESVRQD